MPEEFQTYTKNFHTYQDFALEVGKQLLEIASRVFGIEQDLSDQISDEVLSRYLVFPPVGAEKGLAMGGHADITFFTMISPTPRDNGAAGLVALTNNGWEAVPTVWGCAFVQFGEALSYLTDLKVRPQVHRVAHSPQSWRHSLTTFYTPKASMQYRVYRAGSFKHIADFLVRVMVEKPPEHGALLRQLEVLNLGEGCFDKYIVATYDMFMTVMRILGLVNK